MRAILLILLLGLASVASAASTGFSRPMTITQCPCVHPDHAPDWRQDPIFVGVYEFEELGLIQEGSARGYSTGAGIVLDSSSLNQPMTSVSDSITTATRATQVKQQCGAVSLVGGNNPVATCVASACNASQHCPVDTAFTAGCWVYPNDLGGAEFKAHLRADNFQGGLGDGWQAGWVQAGSGSGKYRFAMDPSGENLLDTATSYSPNEWHHHTSRFVWTSGTGEMQQLIDGIKDSNTQSSAALSTCDLFSIGGYSAATGFRYDECFVAFGALSDATDCRIAVCGIDGCGCSCDWAGDPTDYASAPAHTSFGGPLTCTLPACNETTPSTIVSTTTTSTSSTTSTTTP